MVTSYSFSHEQNITLPIFIFARGIKGFLKHI